MSLSDDLINKENGGDNPIIDNILQKREAMKMSLSNKIPDLDGQWIRTEDVKEAIKELKERHKLWRKNMNILESIHDSFEDEIDEVFGKELI